MRRNLPYGDRSAALVYGTAIDRTHAVGARKSRLCLQVAQGPVPGAWPSRLKPRMRPIETEQSNEEATCVNLRDRTLDSHTRVECGRTKPTPYTDLNNTADLIQS